MRAWETPIGQADLLIFLPALGFFTSELVMEAGGG